MDIGDYFSRGNQAEQYSKKKRYNHKHTSLYLISHLILLNDDSLQNLQKKSSIKSIHLYLTYTWLTKDKAGNATLLQDICNTILDLSLDYNVYLIPFDSQKNDSDLLHNIKRIH
jgi:hypothetical protein